MMFWKQSDLKLSKHTPISQSQRGPKCVSRLCVVDERSYYENLSCIQTKDYNCTRAMSTGAATDIGRPDQTWILLYRVLQKFCTFCKNYIQSNIS